MKVISPEFIQGKPNCAGRVVEDDAYHAFPEGQVAQNCMQLCSKVGHNSSTAGLLSSTVLYHQHFMNQTPVQGPSSPEGTLDSKKMEYGRSMIYAVVSSGGRSCSDFLTSTEGLRQKA